MRWHRRTGGVAVSRSWARQYNEAGRVLFGQVARDFQSEGGKALQLFGSRQDLHAGHAEILEDLCAEAVGAQHLRRDLRGRRMLDALPERADGVGELARRGVV